MSLNKEDGFQINNTRFNLEKRWNWGAFLLGPIWALANQVWIGLIAWLPILLLASSILIVFIKPLTYISIYFSGAFYIITASHELFVQYFCILWYFTNIVILGLNGNRFALKRLNYSENLEIFSLTQKKLSIIGFIFGLPLMYLTIFCINYLIELNSHLFDAV